MLRTLPEPANMEDAMGVFAALDVSQDQTAICVVDQDGARLAEVKLATCPDTIAHWLEAWSESLERVGMNRPGLPGGRLV